jgi:hypothetical protein
MFPYEPAALPQACRAGQSAVAPTTRGRHSESSLEAHTHNPAHCAPSYLDFRREHKHGDALLPCRLGAGQSGLFFLGDSAAIRMYSQATEFTQFEII